MPYGGYLMWREKKLNECKKIETSHANNKKYYIALGEIKKCRGNPKTPVHLKQKRTKHKQRYCGHQANGVDVKSKSKLGLLWHFQPRRNVV